MSHNPYWGNDFLQFFYTLAMRIYGYFQQGPHMELASDELQLLILCLVSTTCALIGTFFVLRKMTMLANALSHTILPGVVVAYLLYHTYWAQGTNIDFSRLLPSDSLLILAALGSAVVTTFLTHLVVTYLPISNDAGIGMVFTLLFAVGIILVTSFTRSTHIGAELLMGNVDALHFDDLHFTFWIFLANACVIMLFWRPLFLTSFDPLFASMCGISLGKINYLALALVSLSAIGAFRAVGVLLFLAFLVTPPLIARRYTNKLKPMAITSCFIAIVASLVGVALSRYILSVYQIACSTSGIIVVLLAALFGLSLAMIRPARA